MQKNNRNANIDLLRVIAMFMVLILHVIAYGIYNWTPACPRVQLLMTFPELIVYNSSFIAVDVFAMISGFLLYKSDFRFSRVASLFLTTLFYTLGITIVFYVFQPDKIKIIDFLKSLYSIGCYWYIAAYFCVLFVVPILVLAADYFRERVFTGSVLLAFISFSSTFFPGDLWGIEQGYNFLWLSICFLVGAVIRFYYNENRIRFSSFFWMSAFIGYVIVCCGIVEVSKYLPATPRNSFLQRILSYSSPLVIGGAISFMLMILLIKKMPTIISIAACSLGPLCLSVYLLHMEPLVKINLLYGCLAKWKGSPFCLCVLFLFCGVVFLFANAVEYIRLKIFKLCGMEQIYSYLDHNRFAEYISPPKKNHIL